jgi:hypothetical protein
MCRWVFGSGGLVLSNMRRARQLLNASGSVVPAARVVNGSCARITWKADASITRTGFAIDFSGEESTRSRARALAAPLSHASHFGGSDHRRAHASADERTRANADERAHANADELAQCGPAVRATELLASSGPAERHLGQRHVKLGRHLLRQHRQLFVAYLQPSRSRWHSVSARVAALAAGHCVRRARSEAGYPLRFSFSRFATEQGFDTVRVYDGPTSAVRRAAAAAPCLLELAFTSAGYRAGAACAAGQRFDGARAVRGEQRLRTCDVDVGHERCSGRIWSLLHRQVPRRLACGWAQPRLRCRQSGAPYRRQTRPPRLLQC